MNIRKMNVADLGAVVSLAQQLGYWVALDEAHGRFERLLGRTDQVLFVAVGDDSQIYGWSHAAEVLGILAAPRAELRALVVDESRRRQGIGRQLVQACEAWARTLGLVEVRLGTRTSRQEAHDFYQSLGYATKKTVHVFGVEL